MGCCSGVVGERFREIDGADTRAHDLCKILVK